MRQRWIVRSLTHRHRLQVDAKTVYKKIIALLLSIILSGCEPQSTRLEDIDLQKLEGMQLACANRATRAAIESLSSDTEWSDLLSLGSTTEAILAVTNKTHLALQECITDIYLMGIEDGRILEREVY